MLRQLLRPPRFPSDSMRTSASRFPARSVLTDDLRSSSACRLLGRFPARSVPSEPLRSSGSRYPARSVLTDSLRSSGTCRDGALLPARNFDVLHAGAAGAQWPQTFIAARKVGALQTQADCTR